MWSRCNYRRSATCALVGLLAVVLAGCHSYNAPPEPKLLAPEGGAFAESEPVTVQFSEAISPQTLAVRLWPAQRTDEGEIAAGVEPLVDICTYEESPCGPLTITIVENGSAAQLALGGDLGKAGQPMVLEIVEGLADPDGSQTGISYYYDFQFRTAPRANTEPVHVDNGVYILGATVQEPLPAVLTLVSQVRVLEDGQFALAGAEGDADDDAPKTSIDPAKVQVDTSPSGWTAYASGFVTLKDDGTRLLETDAFDVFVPLGSFDVYLDEVRLFAEIRKDQETGHDMFDGTLSYEKVRLADETKETVFEGGTAPLQARYAPRDKVPQGHPKICGDLCGAVLGYCDPPDDFPGEDFEVFCEQ